ncbi:MAG TPA: hypothetical protein ENK85_08630 [Saprospiraceae bacterium]|nr:hypothetical protein [Saprospiraceae bacterium]
MPDNKDIDKLFQQGVERYDFEYNPDAWAEMEVLLDEDKRKRRFLWWFGGFLGVAIVLGLFVFFNPSTDKTGVIPETNDTITKHIPDSPKAPIQNIKNNSTPTQNRPTAIQPAEAEKNVTPSSAKAKIFSNKKIQDLQDIQPSRTDGLAVKNKIQSSNATNRVDSLSEKNTVNPHPSVSDKNDFFANGIINRLAVVEPYLEAAIPEIDSLLAQNTPKIAPKFSKQQFLIGAYLGSEVSAVEVKDISKNGFRLGGQLVYRFGGKFETNIGLSYIRKKYTVGEGKYSPPTGFWTRKIAPKSTEATCKILEVPVSFGFFPKGYTQNGFYGQLGLLSYFMRQEQYDYAYNLPDPDLIRHWETQNENNHWFGLGQLSIGYQRVISPKISSQFGPYLHIPIKGVGHGQVKLWSLGLDWKLNFRLK